jgi:hypothetical protein
MRYLLAFLLFAVPTFAEPEIEPPVITFAQKVDIVVAGKKNPNIFDIKIEQDKATVKIDAIVDRNLDRETAKKIAENLILMTKAVSLDDEPTEKEAGTGLYDYKATIRRTDAVVAVIAEKPAKKKKITFEVPAEIRPMTADEDR